MGVRLLPPPRLYRSELAKSESRRVALLLVELDTAGVQEWEGQRREQDKHVTSQLQEASLEYGGAYIQQMILL